MNERQKLYWSGDVAWMIMKADELLDEALSEIESERNYHFAEFSAVHALLQKARDLTEDPSDFIKMIDERTHDEEGTNESLQTLIQRGVPVNYNVNSTMRALASQPAIDEASDLGRMCREILQGHGLPVINETVLLVTNAINLGRLYECKQQG